MKSSLAAKALIIIAAVVGGIAFNVLHPPLLVALPLILLTSTGVGFWAARIDERPRALIVRDELGNRVLQGWVL